MNKLLVLIILFGLASCKWPLVPFTKQDAVNPILGPGEGRFMDPIRHREVAWEEKDVFNPAAVIRNDSVYLLYRAQDKLGQPAGTSRIGLAVSADGLHFIRRPRPVLYPDNDAWQALEWEGGCEDPRVVENERGLYCMTYTAFDGRVARLMIATSSDLEHWTKHGPAFARAYGGKYKDSWSKSGSIVSKYESGHIVATKVNGKYWMYWGDKEIWAATSDDLINWTPVELHTGELKVVLATRRKHFDSDLVESGPPALLRGDGILLIYNGRNIPAIGDTGLPEGTYAGGQALFDRGNPVKMIDRMDKYFIRPDKPYETEGQVNQVCFLEALVRLRGKWFLYYGTADSKIAVAVK
jgi:beta-1,2-mannosidase